MANLLDSGAAHEIADGLIDIGKHHGAAAGQRTQQDLQAPIAANVIERAPDGRLPAQAICQRSHQTGERMDRELRTASGPRREQHPFGFDGTISNGTGRDDPIGAGNEVCGVCDLRGWSGSVGHNGVDLGVRHRGQQMFRREVRSTQHQPPGDAIQLHQSQGSRQLPLGRDHHGVSAQRLRVDAEAETRRKVAQPEARMGVGQDTARGGSRRGRQLKERSPPMLLHVRTA